MNANLPRLGVPLIADMHTGYGGPLQRRGVSIEEQVQSKRCGHLGGKEVVATSVFVSRVTAAVSARRGLGSGVVVIARTDALQKRGDEEAVG